MERKTAVVQREGVVHSYFETSNVDLEVQIGLKNAEKKYICS